MSLINERDWAARTAMRLRIVQATMLESDSKERGVDVWEFILDALRELPPTDEKKCRLCMKALDLEFPFFEARPTLEVQVRSDPPPPTESRLPPPTPETALEQFLIAASSLSVSERAKYGDKLERAGFLLAKKNEIQGDPTTKMPLSLPIYEEERERLQRTVIKIMKRLESDMGDESGYELNLNRCMQMLGLLSEQYLLVHPHVWALWDYLSSSNHLTTTFKRPTLAAPKALASFLLGGTTARRADVGEMVTRSFHLMNALIAAVADAGQDFAAWFFQKFGPENIQSLMQFETSRGSVGPAEFWQRYCTLVTDLNETELKEQFHAMLGKAMSRHLNRRPNTT